MSLEDQLQDFVRRTPKPVIALIAIVIAIVALLLLQPPHTICDTQKENLKKNQEGVLFPVKVGKQRYPGKIQAALESCGFGSSSGSCYEYFSILKRVALSVKGGASECFADMLSISIESYAKFESFATVGVGSQAREELAKVEYRTVTLDRVLSDGVEMMVRQAWGERPPEPGLPRFGWLQESEMATFCHLQDVLRIAKGNEAWRTFQRELFKKLPGEAPPPRPDGSPPVTPAVRSAAEVLSENEILSRSLFSVGCGNYR